MNANIRTLGGSIGTAVVASILASSVGSIGHPSEAGYTGAFLVFLGVSLFGALACLLIPGMPRLTLRRRQPTQRLIVQVPSA